MGYDSDVLVDDAVRTKTVAEASKGFLKLAAGMAKPKPEFIQPLPVVVPAPAPTGKGPTTISVNVEISGAVNSSDRLEIYGKIDGNVRASSVSVCPGGAVNGDVTAETVTVTGTVNGRIFGKCVHLLAGAVVTGDIFHSGLGVDPAAVFDGASRRVSDPLADAPAMPTKKS